MYITGHMLRTDCYKIPINLIYLSIFISIVVSYLTLLLCVIVYTLVVPLYCCVSPTITN